MSRHGKTESLKTAVSLREENKGDKIAKRNRFMSQQGFEGPLCFSLHGTLNNEQYLPSAGPQQDQSHLAGNYDFDPPPQYKTCTQPTCQVSCAGEPVCVMILWRTCFTGSTHGGPFGFICRLSRVKLTQRN